MFDPRVDQGDLRALQPVDQAVDQRRARSARADDDDAGVGGTACAPDLWAGKAAAAAPVAASARKARRLV
jgi:hypothetical protein